jgi:hypothetical protein
MQCIRWDQALLVQAVGIDHLAKRGAVQSTLYTLSLYGHLTPNPLVSRPADPRVDVVKPGGMGSCWLDQ